MTQFLLARREKTLNYKKKEWDQWFVFVTEEKKQEILSKGKNNMCTFIGAECLAANALIELYEQGIKEISFEDLADYGLLVVENYENEIAERAILIFDQERLEGLVIHYSEFFEVKNKDKKKYICLKENVDIRQVKEKFRWTLSYAMLKTLKKVNINQVVQFS